MKTTEKYFNEKPRLKRTVFAIVFLFYSLNIFSQNTVFQVSWDNDLFNIPNQTDRYYTNGLNIDFYHPALNRSFINAILYSGNDLNIKTTGIKLYQGIYTPADIHASEILKLDRPYASVVMISQEHIAVNSSRKYRVTTSVGIGVLGRYGGGALFQNFVHSLTPKSGSANGWGNQLKNDLILNYSAQLEKGIFQNKYSQLSVFGQAQAGTLRNRVAVGGLFSVGILEPYFQTSFGHSLHKKFRIQVFGKAQIDYIYYDATLEGGIFRNNDYSIPEENIKHNRLKYTFGLKTSIEKIQIETGRVWQSKEFEGAYSHAWGYIKFVCFIT